MTHTQRKYIEAHRSILNLAASLALRNQLRDTASLNQKQVNVYYRLQIRSFID